MAFHSAARWSLFFLLSLGLSVPLPAVAQAKPKPKVSPELEQQILEVIRKHPEVVYEVLKKYAEEQQALQQRQELEAQANAIKKILQDTRTLIGDSPTMGAADRKIVLVEFSDYQCGVCAQASANVKKFMAKHQGKVTRVYKHFPLTQVNPQALPAAKAAWAAHKQGKFWEYHDALFANQAKLGEEFYLQQAQQLKLDLNKFKADYAAADNAIVADFRLGRSLTVSNTPSFAMNGELFTGVTSVEELEKILARVQKK